MSIGTSLFHSLSLQNMTRVGDRIADLQEQVSSGRTDPRPSVDPVRALRLSAAREQQQALERFGTNLDHAQSRLDQADIVLGEAGDMMRRIGELALRAASDTATETERDSIATEVRALREGLLGLANARDETGRALFGGFRTQADPFEETAQGVVYRGDGGQPRLQVSESIHIATGVSGAEVFRGAGAGDVFATIDDFLGTLGGVGDRPQDRVTAPAGMELRLSLGRDPAQWAVTLEGPSGRADLRFVAAEGALSGAVDSVNAATAETGISATLDPDSGALRLVADGPVTLSGVGVTPAQRGTLMQVRDGAGGGTQIVAPDQTRAATIDRVQAATDHLIDQRTRLGALSANAARQAEVIDNRKLSMEKAVSGLEDLDLADALTRLQQALLTRDAAQQTYARITQQSLFDFLR
jgi:flagellar hook-associated protein 3 FlgL